MEASPKQAWDVVRDELVRGIEFGPAYQLVFLFTHSAVAVAYVHRRMRDFLAHGQQKQLHRFIVESPDELLGLRTGIFKKGSLPNAGCIWIQCLEWDALGIESGPWQNAWGELFARLNSQRSVLESEFKCALFVVGPPNAKWVIQRAAPDLWSKRFNVLELEGNSVPLLGASFWGDTSDSPVVALADIAREVERRQGTPGLSLSLALIDKAAMHFRAGEFLESGNAAHQALAELNRAAHGNRFEIYVSSAHAIWGCAEEALGNLDAAADHIYAAIMLRERIGHADLIPYGWFVTAGQVDYRRNEPKQALQWFNQALEHLHAAKVSNSLQDTLKLREAEVRMRMAYVYELAHERVDADAAALNALQLSRDVYNSEPTNAFAALVLFGLLLDVGNLSRVQGRDVISIVSFREAVSIARGAVERFSNDLDWRQRLSFALNRLGDALSNVDERKAALAVREEALEIRREVWKETPDHLKRARALSRTLRKISRFRAESGDYAGAYSGVLEAIEFDEMLIRTRNAQDLLALQTDSYAHASQMAHKLGKRDEALHWARKAVEAATNCENASGKGDSLAKHREWLAQLEAAS